MEKQKERFEAVRKHNAGKEQLASKDLKKTILVDLKEGVQQLDALRTGSKTEKAIDMTFAEFAKARWGFAPSENGAADAFYQALGIDPSSATIDTLYTTPEVDNAHRWLIPEIFREAIRLGLRQGPIHPALTVTDQTVSQRSVIMPHINMSDAMVRKIGEAETIGTGTVSFGQKTVNLQKMGIGMEVPDEVLQYVSLNVVSLFMQDVGVKLGTGLDVMAIETLISGDQAGGGESAPVIGVKTINEFAYKDILHTWLRMGRLGRMPQGMLLGEDAALEILELPEFKALAGKETLKTLDLTTAVPNSQKVWLHGSVPANQAMLVNTRSAMLKLTSQALRVENDRIVNKQINGTYATLTTGFANIFRDARLIIDKSLDFSAQGFPTWMDVDADETEAITR